MTTPRIDGLDIHDVYQPVTDWEAATNYRLMSCKLGEGRGPYRRGGRDYFLKFREHDVPLRGVYWWLRSDSTIQAQFDAFANGIAGISGLRPDEFIQLDWETTPGIRPLTATEVLEWLRLVDEVWPDRTIVYASDWVPGFAQWRAAEPDRPLWYANYNTGNKSTGGWAECEKWDATVWQWSSTQMVPGIATRVDVNHVFDWAALERIARVKVVDNPVVVPPVVVPKPTVQTDPPGGDLMITVFQPADCKAEFIGMCDRNGNALEVEWINTAAAQARRDAHLAAGARVDTGAATAGRFRNCKLSGPIPFGDTYPWSASDFFRVVP